MYNRKKMIENLKGMINLLPDDLSPESNAKKQELLLRLKNLEERSKKQQSNDATNNPDDNCIVKG